MLNATTIHSPSHTPPQTTFNPFPKPQTITIHSFPKPQATDHHNPHVTHCLFHTSPNPTFSLSAPHRATTHMSLKSRITKTCTSLASYAADLTHVSLKAPNSNHYDPRFTHC
ncbi:hypothetical protein AVEN_124177-1 [Araneus ventricosus]|uniref:Uncharacterized protein n=1 Tax=Araneus ventricosus TaxID=182803 RepID=A0A4Y2NMR2_ARAVE|nr:hypothetical protein AVEN_124177-1 [Araneus ventricosus]